jgi:hypothetical protein
MGGAYGTINIVGVRKTMGLMDHCERQLQLIAAVVTAKSETNEKGENR